MKKIVLPISCALLFMSITATAGDKANLPSTAKAPAKKECKQTDKKAQMECMNKNSETKATKETKSTEKAK